VCPREGAPSGLRAVRRHEPRLVAVFGVTAYRTAFGRPRATIGLQPDDVGERPVWVLPNPSGLNAYYKPAYFARLYAQAGGYAEALARRRDSAGHERPLQPRATLTHDGSFEPPQPDRPISTSAAGRRRRGDRARSART
jgi:hypothetical protein